METEQQNEQAGTERHLTISSKPGPGNALPDIRVAGKWLEQLGFKIGNTVTLYVEHGRIVIVADEAPYQKPPDPSQARKDKEKKKRERARWQHWQSLKQGDERDAWFRGARSLEQAAALPKIHIYFPTVPGNTERITEGRGLVALQEQGHEIARQ
jgi:hypothetical protein